MQFVRLETSDEIIYTGSVCDKTTHDMMMLMVDGRIVSGKNTGTTTEGKEGSKLLFISLPEKNSLPVEESGKGQLNGRWFT